MIKVVAMTKTITSILIFFVSLLFFVSPAQAWWNKDWQYRKEITIDAKNVTGPAGTTLVLVKLTSGNFNNFADALDNGADIRFVDKDDKTAITGFHIDTYDKQTGIALIWVAVPALNGGEQRKIWMYFGNKEAPVGENIKGSFDPDYVAAYHFSETPGQPSADSTANANTAQNGPPGVETGLIGRAAQFLGQGAITIAESPSLAMAAGGQFTFSVWVKPAQLSGEAALFARGPLLIGLTNGVPFVSVGSGRTQATAAIKQADWTHLAVVADGETIKIFVNGVEAGAASAALPAISGPISLGGADGFPFTGSLDEVRLSKVARPATMISIMANAEGAGGDKAVVVADGTEKQGGSGNGVLFFIISKLEPLDQGIVGICMVLLAMAVTVMVAKIRYLNKSQRGNAVFMRRFRAMHEELVPVADVPGITPAEIKFIGNSPLGRLYEVGIAELEVRRQKLGVRPISGEAVEAMRAAVDAEAVAENQKFDKFMVILTIAISGGPFIGLLGTVIGVMSTFGGVALAGDVNVNAIAPGIAAALLATIAGLAAAIPSLFGYNYLNSRITTIADEMRVFIDRLITRLAEMQSDAAHDAGPPPAFRQAAE